MKILRKLAVIRDNEDIICPFGLSINKDCMTAGDSVDRMIPIPEDSEFIQQLSNHNRKFLANNPSPGRCKYAAHLFKNKSNVVDCNFGENDAGITPEVSFVGSPYYSQIGEGIGIGGLYNYPVTYYTDGMEYRNLYYGMSNWASPRTFKCLLRQSLWQSLKIKKG